MNPSHNGNTVFHPRFGGRWSPEPLREDGSRYPSMGYIAWAWISSKLGLQPDGWQLELFRRGMLYDPDTLDWITRDILVVGPEGIGKSTMWGALGVYFLDAPCLPPEDAPRPYPDPDIPVVSAALSLTEHVHRAAKKFIENGPLQGRLVVEKKKIYRADDDDARIQWPAGSGAYQQGKDPKPAILEEELHVADERGVKADGKETIEVVSSKRSKTARPKVQRWTITNPDDGDPDSLLGKRWKHAERVLTGEIEDPELVVVHYHAALPWNLDDPDDLRRGLRQSTPSSWSDVEAIAAKYEKDRQSVGRFMRYSGGLFIAGDEQVLPDGGLESLAVAPEFRAPPPRNVRGAFAFDGARNRDTVGLYGTTEHGYGFIAPLLVDEWEIAAVRGDQPVCHWERPPDTPAAEWRYKDFRDEISGGVIAAMRAWPGFMLAVDDQWWDEEADEWEELFPGRVVRGYQSEGPEAWKDYRRAVLEESLFHDGYEPLYRHMRNAKEIVRTSYGTKTFKLGKKRDDGDHPIDLLICACYSWRLAMNLPEPDSLDDWLEAYGVTV